MDNTKTIIERMSDYHLRQKELSLDTIELGALISALRVSEEKSAMLGALIESTDDAIISKDLNGIITSWNGSAERIFGFSPAEMIGRPILQLIPLHLQSEEPVIIGQIKKGMRVDHFETHRLRKDGTMVEVSLTISPIYNSSGKIIGISKIARDMTMHRKAEVNGRRLAAIIETSDDAIVSKDLNSIITSWNGSAERMFGYTADEMIGQSILKIIPTERHEEEPRILSQLRQGIRVEHFETQRLRKDGSLIEVSLSISPIKDSAGQVVGVSKIARDITDKRLLERKKDDFVGFVSHELKTPLTSLKSYLQVALKKKEDPVFISNALDRAQLQISKMENIIAGFLDLSRSEGGFLRVDKIDFDLAPLLETCAADARVASQKHQVICNFPPGLVVNGDQEKLSMVITNLISNAQKYSPQGGQIEISCLVSQTKVRVNVKDEGIGISISEQKQMFKKFHRVENQQTRSIPGFGIGLYLASTILALHDSSLQVTSEPGKGSVFSFELSLA